MRTLAAAALLLVGCTALNPDYDPCNPWLPSPAKCIAEHPGGWDVDRGVPVDLGWRIIDRDMTQAVPDFATPDMMPVCTGAAGALGCSCRFLKNDQTGEFWLTCDDESVGCLSWRTNGMTYGGCRHCGGEGETCCPPDRPVPQPQCSPGLHCVQTGSCGLADRVGCYSCIR